MRNLASVQVINEIHPIPNADAIEVATVLGWHVVVKKDSFHRVGEKVVYCEIDSVMPENNPAFDFLKNEKGEMSRIRTVCMRGQISQGIVFPMSILPEGEYEVGQDVTDILGVKKYEPEIPPDLIGKKKNDFPSFVSKSDETRIQILQDVLNKYEGVLTYESEKIDGTSATIFLNNGEFGVCSRSNEWFDEPTNKFWRVAKAHDLERKLRSLNMDIVLQGELFGEGIQGNKYKMNDVDIFYFNIFDIKKHEYFDFEDFRRFIKELNLNTVPILATNVPLISNIDALVEKSIGKSVVNPKIQREGIVMRPMKEINDLQMGRVSFKAINPKFLLNNKDA